MGVDGSFSEFTIIIGCFYTGENLPTSIDTLCIPALKIKGFKEIKLVTNEAVFI